MTKYIGRRISVGIGKESTRGTAVAAEYWLPWTSLAFEGKVETVLNESAQGTIYGAQNSALVKEWGEGSLDCLIGDKSVGLLFTSILGTVASVEKGADAGVYDHTITLAETPQHQSLTLNIDEANGDKQYPLCVVDKISIGFETGKILDMSVDLLAKKGATAALTPAAVSENLFRPQDFSFKIAADIASLEAAQAVVIRSANIDISSNNEADDVLGSTQPNDFLNKEFMVEGDFEFVYNSTTVEDYVLAGTQKALRFTIENADVTIGATSHPKIVITLAKVVFTEKDRKRDLNGIVTLKANFKALYSVSDSKFGSIVVTNLVTAY